MPTLLLAFMLIGSDSAAPTASSSRTIEIASCSLTGGKSAIISKISNHYNYTFGRSGHPEISLDADPASKKLFKDTQSFPRAGFSEVRFVNGATSYVLFRYFNLGNFDRNYEGATETSGLLVIQNGERIAGHLCHDGEGPEEEDLRALPDDTMDLLSDIVDVVERKPASTVSSRRMRKNR